MVEMAERARCYYEDFEAFDPKAAKAHLRPVAKDSLIAVREGLASVADWTKASSQGAVEAAAARLDLKLGKVAQPLRVALTGQAASPGIGTTLLLIGRKRALQRIDRALAYIDERISAGVG
jgi:glutamyl-tRNA synthetase